MADHNQTKDVDTEISELMDAQGKTHRLSARSFVESERGDSEAEIEGAEMIVENDDQVNDPDEEFDTDGYTDEPQETETAPTLNELFAGTDSVRLRIAPRIMLNVARGSVDVPETVRVGDAFYSVNSPMRKGVGKKDNPFGLIRGGLADLAKYVDRMADRDVVFFGPASETEKRVSDMMFFMEKNVNEIMYGEFADPENPMFKFIERVEPEDEEDEDEEEDGLDNVGVTEVNATATTRTVEVSAYQSYKVDTWAVFDTDEDGTIVIRPTISVNVNMPLLVGSSSLIKPFATIQRIVSNYAKAANMEEDDFRLTFAFSSEQLLDPAVVELLHHYSSDDNSEAVIISANYLQKSSVDLDNDVYRLFPAGNTAQQAISLLMPEDSDILLLI